MPIRYSLESGVEAEAPTIDQEQTRYDARAEIPISGFFSQIRARGGYADYHHDEIEDTGEIGSSFFSKGGEGRVELVQTERNRAGAAPAASNISSATPRSAARRNSCPTAARSRPACSRCRRWSAARARFEGGGRVEFSKLTAEDDDAARHAVALARLHDLLGLARRPV